MSLSLLYLSPPLMKKIIESGNVKSLDLKNYYIGSVGDLLLETEYYKEECTFDQFKQKFDVLCESDNKAFFIQELNRDTLLANLFDTIDDQISIDVEINSTSTPHYSINYIALKPNADINYWDEELVTEMKDFHQ